MSTSPRRSALFGLFFLLCSSLWFEQPVSAGQVNITVDDADSSILYEPASSWHSSQNSTPCSFCLAPSEPYSAFKSTWHQGLHIIPISDSDDDVRSSGHDDDDDDDSKGQRNARKKGRRRHDDDKGEDDGDKGSSHDSENDDPADDGPFTVAKFDADDPQFVDTPVFAQFNFTGSAIYLYCLLPLGLPASANATPTLTNLTFTLDAQPSGQYFHAGSASASGFQANTSVLAIAGLPSTAHSLRIDLGPNSAFLLDYIVFSEGDVADKSPPASSTEAVTSPSPTTDGADAVDAKTKEHNIATFGGAVGGSVGLLGVIAICLATSIYRRRRLSAQRQRRERGPTRYMRDGDVESFHTDASEDGPPMQGPEPFIPRYFPGTVPVAPPPYISRTPEVSEVTPLSYADRPPPTPPPGPVPLLADMDEDADVPPSFVVAISSPEPPLLANIMRRALTRPIPTLPEDDNADEPEDRRSIAGVLEGTGTASSRAPSVHGSGSALRPASLRSSRSIPSCSRAEGRADGHRDPPSRAHEDEDGL